MRFCVVLLLALSATTWALAVIPEDRADFKNRVRPDRSGFDDGLGGQKFNAWLDPQPTRTQTLRRRSGGGNKANKQDDGGGHYTQKSRPQAQQSKNKNQAQHNQANTKTPPAQNKVAQPAKNRLEVQALKKNQNQQKIEDPGAAAAGTAPNAFDVLSAALSSQRHPAGKVDPVSSYRASTRVPRPSPNRTPKTNFASGPIGESTRTRTPRPSHLREPKTSFGTIPTGGNTRSPQNFDQTKKPPTPSTEHRKQKLQPTTSKQHHVQPSIYNIPGARPVMTNPQNPLDALKPKKTDIHQMDYQGTLGYALTSSAYGLGYKGTAALLSHANARARRKKSRQSQSRTAPPAPRTRRQVEDESDLRPTGTQAVRWSEREEKGHIQVGQREQNKIAIDHNAAITHSPTNAFEVLSSALSSQGHHPLQQHSTPKYKPLAKSSNHKTSAPALTKTGKPTTWAKSHHNVGWGPTDKNGQPLFRSGGVVLTGSDGKKHTLEFATSQPDWSGVVGHTSTTETHPSCGAACGGHSD